MCIEVCVFMHGMCVVYIWRTVCVCVDIHMWCGAMTWSGMCSCVSMYIMFGRVYSVYVKIVCL